MDGLLLLLVLIGVTFFVMTRFTGGSHMSRGEESGCCGLEPKLKQVDEVDPVCGGAVSDDQGYSKSHDGRTYRFCSRECLDEFEADPEKFGKHDERGEATLTA